MLETLISIIHVLVAIFLIVVVLVQGGNQGGIGAAFGGGNTSGIFGASGATSFLSKLTYGAAALFVATTMAMTYQQGKMGDVGLRERLRNAAPAAGSEQSTMQPGPTEAAPADAAPAAEVAPVAAPPAEVPASEK